MALSGLHVAFGYAGFAGPLSARAAALARKPVSSQTLASAGTSTIVAPPVEVSSGSAIVSLRCSQDAWIAVGSAPDATNGPRRFLAANTDLDLLCSENDRVAWIAA
ncbi:hypothetical protein D3218_13175 [Aureimonas flava]|uniref:Uncharacterized protein n=1 Tax=Aureimonas flava TaxID=2320271 RepID=A0A3A1WL87_9HYPH|nr:hypothetical protein [Aureimonas flava]RIY00231.1 hypothetical protein D3218_13175 [Aureimonas flava]